ncbi:MAG: transposase, partial [Taibaiella sp.]|nr:transposase [Taibaiella sp.]
MNRDHTNNHLTLGVDTHLDKHVAVLINDIGQVVDTSEFAVCSQGYEQLFKWTQSFGGLKEAGLEGTGTYGAGLCKYLVNKGITVYEVNRPNRAKRRLRGKSDPTDAENAARSVLANESTAVPKSHDGIVETLRYLVVVRKSAIKARTQAINQIKALLVTAPDNIRKECYVASTCKCISACKNIKNVEDDLNLKTLSSMLKLLADRWLRLTEELKLIGQQLGELTKTSASHLLGQFGVGPYVAATLMVAAGDNPLRLKKESSFAALCGVNPLEASS